MSSQTQGKIANLLVLVLRGAQTMATFTSLYLNNLVPSALIPLHFIMACHRLPRRGGERDEKRV